MTIKYKCRKCNSEKLQKNGKTPAGRQKFHCKNCNFYSTLEPFLKYTEEKKEEIIRAYQERSSLRGVQRIFGLSRTTLLDWLKKKFQNCLK
jgi:insertion element IS1 protein InsB